jgi:uncharacterized protein YjbJ (UPF0337 family)
LWETGSFALQKTYSSQKLEDQKMGTKDQASNRTQDAKARVRKAAGSIAGNRDLKDKGVTDQAKAEMKESLEDAGYKAKGAAAP